MTSKYLSLLAVAFVVGGAFTWGLQHLPASSEAPSRFTEIKAKLLTIPTPKGWYAWGLETFPSGVSNPTSAGVSFANHELNDNSHSASSKILSIYGSSLDGRTPAQWIDYRKIYGNSGSIQSATSTDRTWGMENGRLIVSAVIPTMGGSSILSYYVFDEGIVYRFSLSPAFVVPNIVNSPDAELLRTMVRRFADSLPPLANTAQ